METWLQQIDWVEKLKESWNAKSGDKQKEAIDQLETYAQSILDYWGVLEEEIAVLKKQLKKEETATLYQSKGTVYFKLDMFNEAISYFLKEELTGIDDELRHLYLGYAYLYVNEWVKAKDQFLYMMSFTKDTAILHDVYIGLACISCKQENFEQAIDYFEKARKWLTDNDDVVYNLGVCHFLNQSYEQAILYFYEAIELNGDDGEAYYYLGICLIEIGKRQAGFRAWGQAMPLLNSSDTLLALAYMLEWNGLFRQAIDCYRKLYGDKREIEKCLHGLAWNYGMLNKQELSRQYFNQLFELNPTHSLATQSFQWLQEAWVCK
ncbi:tetratricopeptide repeat protein [Alkalihalobacillus pseudalcaliphilus]|uniref:tetratricopeptide repeat protein n=1 Tax=Alkalihalobacillus pseudalcaliphilus TaxID=79884 RepID=UPI00064D96CC|nr:tetratricopeptide repeat protein [Alkalihalobacillus pseudalcaliphilus]KMK76409.1 hypothetical protein AB990_14560 [Alkalihalobacillus pseudalcaliphilus]